LPAVAGAAGIPSSDIAILGRIGGLGQPLIARQADKVLAGFADCLRKTVASS